MKEHKKPGWKKHKKNWKHLEKTPWKTNNKKKTPPQKAQRAQPSCDFQEVLCAPATVAVWQREAQMSVVGTKKASCLWDFPSRWENKAFFFFSVLEWEFGFFGFVFRGVWVSFVEVLKVLWGFGEVWVGLWVLRGFVGCLVSRPLLVLLKVVSRVGSRVVFRFDWWASRGSVVQKWTKNLGSLKMFCSCWPYQKGFCFLKTYFSCTCGAHPVRLPWRIKTA